jgi:hypothetical protein
VYSALASAWPPVLARYVPICCCTDWQGSVAGMQVSGSGIGGMLKLVGAPPQA